MPKPYEPVCREATIAAVAYHCNMDGDMLAGRQIAGSAAGNVVQTWIAYIELLSGESSANNTNSERVTLPLLL